MDLSVLEDLKARLNLGDMPKPALVGIAAVLVAMLVIVGWRLSETASASEFQVTSASPAAEEAPSSSPEEPSPLFVHVSGEVKEPGLCQVDGGARVAAAIEAAGGFTDDAAIDSVNLAREVSDGEQIVVAKKLSEEEAAAIAPQASASAAPASSGLVNINTASEAELKGLPGIGDVTAAKIVAYRQSNGVFKSIDELKRVDGIGDRKYDAVSGLICV